MTFDTLNSLPLFQGVAGEDLVLLADLAHRESFPKDEVIFEQGARAGKLYILVSGKVEIRFKPEDGEVLIVAIIERGGVFGWSAALGRNIYTSCAVTVEDSHVLSIEGDRLRQLCENHPETGVVILERLAGVIAERLRNTHQQVISLLRQGMRSEEPLAKGG